MGSMHTGLEEEKNGFNKMAAYFAERAKGAGFISPPRYSFWIHLGWGPIWKYEGGSNEMPQQSPFLATLRNVETLLKWFSIPAQSWGDFLGFVMNNLTKTCLK